MALPPRYAFPVVGFIGMSSEASAGFHGFCHGATPVSSMLMMRSVTSCRKSRLAGSGDSATGIGFGLADAAIAFSSPLRLGQTQFRVVRFRTRIRPAALHRRSLVTAGEKH